MAPIMDTSSDQDPRRWHNTSAKNYLEYSLHFARALSTYIILNAAA